MRKILATLLLSVTLFATANAQKITGSFAPLAKEARVQRALLEIKEKYGKNAILKGVSFEEGATARERNRQIGGHSAGKED